MDGHTLLIQTGVPLRMIRGTIKYQIEETGVAVPSKPGHVVTPHRLLFAHFRLNSASETSHSLSSQIYTEAVQ